MRSFQMPSSSEDWLNIERGFRNKFPHACGSMDGKYIVIESPPHSGSEYYNYKRTFSIVLLALVDSNYKFIFVDIGSQGRISDGGVYNNSLLWQKNIRNEINFPEQFPLPAANNNISLPYVFLADGAFAYTHVMKPYPGNHEIGSPKRIFNQHLSRARVVVENTFGILSSVFRIFRRPINLKIETVNDITTTCVLLHNFLRKSVTSSEMYFPPGTLDVYDNNGNLIRRGAWRNINGYNAIQNLPHVPRRPPLTGVNIRNEFTSYFCEVSNNN